MTRSSSPDRGQEWFDTDDVHHAREVVGEHVQRHLGRHLRQCLHQKVRRPHPHLSRRTAARVTPGAICLSSSSHFPLRLYSNCINPVALPPGRDRRATKPEPTGSGTTANTTGTVRVALSITSVARPPVVRMTSGASANSSAACRRVTSALPSPHRWLNRTLWPSVQPNCCNSCCNAANRTFPCASSAVRPWSTPIRRIRFGCCD